TGVTGSPRSWATFITATTSSAVAGRTTTSALPGGASVMSVRKRATSRWTCSGPTISTSACASPATRRLRPPYPHVPQLLEQRARDGRRGQDGAQRAGRRRAARLGAGPRVGEQGVLGRDLVGVAEEVLPRAVDPRAVPAAVDLGDGHDHPLARAGVERGAGPV